MKTVLPLLALLLLAASGSAAFGKHRATTSDEYTTTSAPANSTAPAPKVHIEKQPRNVPASVKSEVFVENGIPKAERKNYVLDHKVPLELGGSNSKSNLQPQPKAEAKTKDQWENYLAAQVRNGKMTLEQAKAEVQQPHAGPPPR